MCTCTPISDQSPRVNMTMNDSTMTSLLGHNWRAMTIIAGTRHASVIRQLGVSILLPWGDG